MFAGEKGDLAQSLRQLLGSLGKTRGEVGKVARIGFGHRDTPFAKRSVAAPRALRGDFSEDRFHAWRPRAGSFTSRRTMTAAMIDSRDFLMAKRRTEAEVMLPAGPKIAFTGGIACNDHQRIWAVLDRVHAKHIDMVLLHGGSPKGAERVAACWADNRNVPQIVFKPDWARHAKAAPFKRNDQLLDVMPIGVVVFPGSGISDNLADKARKLGIPVYDFRTRGGA